MGNSYRIFDDEIQTSDTLPAKVYRIVFDPMSGYSLEARESMELTEKVYGKHKQKLNKVLNTYNQSKRSLGILLTGPKGLGKSFFLRDLATSMVNKGLPVLICDAATPNLCEFIESIKQECMILFDEYEKHFNVDSQNQMLSLFDGTSATQKMYCISANATYNLSEYIIDRPGRFHYHLRFKYPDTSEITEYMKDNLKPEYHNQIPNVIHVSRNIQLNYDCLRALAFELNMGETVTDALEDLNIDSYGQEEKQYYDIIDITIEHDNTKTTLSYENTITLNEMREDTNGVKINLYDDLHFINDKIDISASESNITFQKNDVRFDDVNNRILIYNVTVDYKLDGVWYKKELNEPLTLIKQVTKPSKLLMF